MCSEDKDRSLKLVKLNVSGKSIRVCVCVCVGVNKLSAVISYCDGLTSLIFFVVQCTRKIWRRLLLLTCLETLKGSWFL